MSAMTTPFSGGCACGAIRYESTAEPLMMHYCHCRDCQRFSGGPYSSFVVVPAEAFTLKHGTPRFHASPSEMGGETRRGFCYECGSPILLEPAAAHIIAIRTMSLDDPSWFDRQADAWTSDMQPWERLEGSVAAFEKYPQ
jgi:hypothetical protein